MTARWSALVILAFGVVGCSRGLPPEIDPAAAAAPGAPVPIKPGGEDLGSTSELTDLAELLKLPREELAQRCDELEKTIRRQHQMHLEGALPYGLLPDLRLPLVTPVFRHAAYSRDRGISLPPYMKVDADDPAVASHVARHGDLDAAIKLLGKADDDVIKWIRDSIPEKTYPLEWTRLVALMIHKEQVALASDLKDGAKNLMAIHKQLREVLDPKAKKGPLGVALMGRGLDTLRAAAMVWSAQGRSDLSAQVMSFLTSTGELPRYEIKLPPRLDDPVFAAVPGKTGVVASDPSRVMDLLCIFVPSDASDTCAAFADENGKLVELLLTYRPLLQTLKLHSAEQFAEPLEELRAGKKDEQSPNHRTWDFDNVKLDVTLTPHHPTLGALVRLTTAGTAKTPELPRQFGSLVLDNTFEANRRRLAWGKRTPVLTLVEKALAEISNPLPTRTPADVVVERDPKADVVSRVTFEYADNFKDATPAAGTISRPLLAAAGGPNITVGESGKGAIDFTWSDAKTRYRLRFPYAKERMVTLEVTDAPGADPAERLKSAQAADARDRQERIKTNKALAVVPRQLENMRLGMSLAEFKKALPKSPKLLERELPGYVMAAYIGNPQNDTEAVAREWFAHFDDDKLVDLRIRYVDPTSRPGMFAKKLEALRVKLGAPEATPDTSGLWADLPKRGTNVTYAWHDDVTRLTCRYEGHGVEFDLRDCPLAHAQGAPVTPLEYLPRGAAGVQLGMSKDALLKLGAQKAENDAYLIESPTDDKYDALMVWLDGNRVSRIVARHKLTPALKSDQQASTALLQSWSRDAATIGWPNRQDQVGPLNQSFATRDDLTRYRVFWQSNGERINLYSEWKDVK